MTTYVLVHGVCHGAWCWSTAKQALQELGHEVHTMNLPLTGLDDDAAYVRSVLDDIDGDAILVGHSYGGSVISKAAHGREDVAHLAYIAAIMLDAEDVYLARVAEFEPSLLRGRSSVGADGNLTVDPESAVACFYNECSPQDAAAAANQLRPSDAASLSQPSGGDPWRSVPSTYLVCERDEAINPDLQRWMSTRAGQVITFDTDHSPFLSMTKEFVELLHNLSPAPDI